MARNITTNGKIKKAAKYNGLSVSWTKELLEGYPIEDISVDDLCSIVFELHEDIRYEMRCFERNFESIF